MAARTIKVLRLCMIVIGAWLAGVVAAFLTRNIDYFGILHAGCFLVAAATAPRITFTEIPVYRLWLSLWLPLGLALYAISGDLFGFGPTVSWALIALSFIAGARAANVLQILEQRA